MLTESNWRRIGTKSSTHSQAWRSRRLTGNTETMAESSEWPTNFPVSDTIRAMVLSISERFPRSSQYNPEWLLASISGAANPLWMAEWLTSALDLRPGMRVLDLGCGRATSSIFLHREFGVQVWATDLWFSATENGERIRDAGVEDSVFPMHADARSLPFSDEFFDVIVSLDSFSYYGTTICTSTTSPDS